MNRSFMLQLYCPKLHKGDKRTLRAIDAAENVLGEKLLFHETATGPKRTVNRESLVRTEIAKSGSPPMITNGDKARYFAISGLALPMLLPAGRAMFRAHAYIAPQLVRKIDSHQLLAGMGFAFEAWWGSLDPPTLGHLIYDQLHAPGVGAYGNPIVLPPGIPALSHVNELESAARPAWIGWINYWSDEAAALLGLTERNGDKIVPFQKVARVSGGWVLKVTNVPLDVARPDHLSRLVAAYERFPGVGRAPKAPKVS
jgi:hypothetical protein